MHPLLFQLSFGSWGLLAVPAFGALLSVAFGATFVLGTRRAVRAGLPRTEVMGASVAAAFAGLLAARAGFVVLHPSEVGSFSAAFSLANGGLSGTIGLALGAAVLAWEGRRRGLTSSTLLDVIAPGAALGVALVRVGCFLDGCDFGKPLGAHAPAWLTRLGTFPHGSPAWVEQVVSHGLTPSAAFALPVHPSELYESVAALGLAFAASRLLARQERSGTTALFVLGAYATARVLVDFTRAPSADAWAARAALFVAIGVIAWSRWPRARARHP